MFSIDSDFAITNHEGTAPPREDAISFSDQRGFAKATTAWLTPQYVDLWNSFAGVPPFGEFKPVKKFTDRNTAIKRIWQALVSVWGGDVITVTPAPAATIPAEKPEVGVTLATEEDMPKPKPKPKTKATVRTQAPAKAKSAAAAATTTTQAGKANGSRKDAILALIGRKSGATLAEIMEETGWQAHSVRGFIATLHTKHGVDVSSTKNAAGERTYQATA